MMLATKLQAAAGNATQPNYIEDVFSTYLYTGNAGTQTVTNGIDLSGKGGMVWTKSRSNAYNHSIMDTVRGFNYSGTQTKRLDPSTTDGQASSAGNATQASPLSNGFSITTSGGGGINFYNASGATYVSWTFREQPKFFDVVTFTAGTSTDRRISHSLNAIPGFWIMKALEPDGPNWPCYHRSLGLNAEINLNLTNASASGSNRWGSAPTSTTLGINEANMCNAGYQYVLYIFAHDAGGFGVAGTDNVISCGSLVSGTVQDINLGYEPQWIMYKNASGSTGGWTMFDTMRGMTTDGSGAYLQANTSAAEATASAQPSPLATGFRWNYTGNSGQTFIYIAIRRGPMKVPTSGTSVFAPVVASVSSSITVTTGFPVDMSIGTQRQKVELANNYAFDRLRGSGKYLSTNNTNAEAGTGTTTSFNTSMTAYIDNYSAPVFGETSSYGTNIYWNFKRAPSFFDEVCYTGTGVTRYVDHNLTVAPELLIVKNRSASPEDWSVYSATLGNTSRLKLNLTDAVQTGVTHWGSTTPTATQFRVGTQSSVNGSGNGLVAYLFATCAGVSKVGSYTGTATTKQIDCGFTGGARFVLIKRTNSTGDWYVWDSARGIVSGNDPYLLLNSTAAEVTNTDYIDTYSAGFEISSTAPAAINASGGTFIFLAIA